jgi:hypothetical protein
LSETRADTTKPPQARPEKRENGFATASLVFALVAPFLFFTTSPLAIGFGIFGLRRVRRGFPGKNRALAGVILGVVGLLIGAAWWFLVLAIEFRGSGDLP